MPIRQRIMTLNGNAGVGTVNAITKNLRKGNKLIKLRFKAPAAECSTGFSNV